MARPKKMKEAAPTVVTPNRLRQLRAQVKAGVPYSELGADSAELALIKAELASLASPEAGELAGPIRQAIEKAIEKENFAVLPKLFDRLEAIQPKVPIDCYHDLSTLETIAQTRDSIAACCANQTMNAGIAQTLLQACSAAENSLRQQRQIEDAEAKPLESEEAANKVIQQVFEYITSKTRADL